MRRFRSFSRDRRGSVGLDYAIAIPILVTMMIGIVQFAVVLHTAGVMRHALGEGLRLAKVDPTASTIEVKDAAKGSMKGVLLSGITKLEFRRSATARSQIGTMTMEYRLEPIIPFASIPPFTLSETRKVYLPS